MIHTERKTRPGTCRIARLSASFAASIGLMGPTLTSAANAQDVILSEIRADSTATWVEIHNRSAAPQDLSDWSLYLETKTVGMPQNYWWPFPGGTTLAPDEYVRVFWHQDEPLNPPPGSLYTGTAPHGYLFSLGGEALRPWSGALALIDSQTGAHMGTASHITDWVSWGETGFIREHLAIQNGVWELGSTGPQIPPNHSFARNTAAVGTLARRLDEWFLDASPTPMASNIAGLEVESYGPACTVPGHHLVGTPTLRTTSLPLLGNADFGYVLENTTGFFGENMVLFYSAGARPAAQPNVVPAFPGASCEHSLDATRILAVLTKKTDVMQTVVPLPLNTCSPAVAGLEIHTQAIVFDWLPNAYPPFQGVSNAVRVVIGY